MYKSHTSFNKFAPKDFIYFDSIANETIVLILLSNYSVLVNSNSIGFFLGGG